MEHNLGFLVIVLPSLQGLYNQLGVGVASYQGEIVPPGLMDKISQNM